MDMFSELTRDFMTGENKDILGFPGFSDQVTAKVCIFGT